MFTCDVSALAQTDAVRATERTDGRARQSRRRTGKRGRRTRATQGMLAVGRLCYGPTVLRMRAVGRRGRAGKGGPWGGVLPRDPPPRAWPRRVEGVVLAVLVRCGSVGADGRARR
jgi:hypothetical protein